MLYGKTNMLSRDIDNHDSIAEGLGKLAYLFLSAMMTVTGFLLLIKGMFLTGLLIMTVGNFFLRLLAEIIIYKNQL